MITLPHMLLVCLASNFKGFQRTNFEKKIIFLSGSSKILYTNKYLDEISSIN